MSRLEERLESISLGTAIQRGSLRTAEQRLLHRFVGRTDRQHGGIRPNEIAAARLQAEALDSAGAAHRRNLERLQREAAARIQF